jgi:outer membrane immunogenic protein
MWPFCTTEQLISRFRTKFLVEVLNTLRTFALMSAVQNLVDFWGTNLMGRRFNLLASTALTTSSAFVSVTALAADLRMPVKAPPIIVPTYSWNGCYVGLNAGGMSSRAQQQVTIPGFVTFDSDFRDSSFIGGGQIGCNWQFDRNWVLGVEGDINYAHLDRGQNFHVNLGGEDTVGSQSTRLHWLATVRGRIGYAFDRTLLYATGGVAIGNVQSSVSAVVSTDAIFAGSYSQTRVGWTIGGGIEQAFTDRVSAKLEYLHFDLGSAGYNVIQLAGATPLPGVWTASTRVSGDIFRVGVNVKLTP